MVSYCSHYWQQYISAFLSSPLQWERTYNIHTERIYYILIQNWPTKHWPRIWFANISVRCLKILLFSKYKAKKGWSIQLKSLFCWPPHLILDLLLYCINWLANCQILWTSGITIQGGGRGFDTVCYDVRFRQNGSVFIRCRTMAVGAALGGRLPEIYTVIKIKHKIFF